MDFDSIKRSRSSALNLTEWHYREIFAFQDRIKAMHEKDVPPDLELAIRFDWTERQHRDVTAVFDQFAKARIGNDGYSPSELGPALQDRMKWSKALTHHVIETAAVAGYQGAVCFHFLSGEIIEGLRNA